jgi:hypothetical protein
VKSAEPTAQNPGGTRTYDPREVQSRLTPISAGQVAQNSNGSTETDILPSDGCWTVKLTSFEAFVSSTITDMEPLHFSVRLSSLVDVVTISSPRRYNGFCLDFSASELVSLDFAKFEFLAAYLTSALLWSSETAWSTAFRVSKESHSGLALQLLRKIGKRKLQKAIGSLRKYSIEVRHAPAWLKSHRATDSKKHCSKVARFSCSPDGAIAGSKDGGLRFRLRSLSHGGQVGSIRASRATAVPYAIPIAAAHVVNSGDQ